MISIDDFAKVQLKVGTIISAEELEGSDKLLKLQVDFGLKGKTAVSDGAKEAQDSEQVGMTEESADPSPQDDKQNDIRQVLSGIKQWYKPEDLVGKQFVFVTNLAPRKMMGLESQAMIMAAEGDDKPIPLTVSEKVPNGAGIR